VQATLVNAMRKLADFRGDASLFTWVFTIRRHEVVDWLRVQCRHADAPEKKYVEGLLVGEIGVELGVGMTAVPGRQV